MFKNYLKIAFRNLVRQKVYSFINIASLAIGIACCILLIVYIHFELSYDRYHEKADRIYRLGREMTMGGNEIREPLSNGPIAEVLRMEYPEVVNATRFRSMGRIPVKYGDRQFYENRIWYADDSVFDVFTFPMISGDPKTALSVPYSVVITEEMAEKYFGDEDPIGKIFKFNGQFDYHVTGVIKNVPQNSHFIFDMLCSFETLYVQNTSGIEDWLSFNLLTYILLKKDFNYKELEQKFPALIDKHAGADLKAYGYKLKFFLHPLTKIYLYSHLEGNPPGRITNIFWNAILAVFILLIACINFMNLATARSATRAKEVGMRKVIGANRSELIKQFLGEALFCSFIALMIALVLVELALPFLGSLAGIELSISYVENLWLIVGFIGLAFAVGIVAGSYPAFFLSAFQPVQVLKGSLNTGAAKSRFRSILVVVQFSLSICFIHGIEIISNQLNYMKNKDIGFDKENVVVLPIVSDNIRKSINSIKDELKSYTGIISVAAASKIPGWRISRSGKIPEGFARDEMQIMDDLNVDHDLIPTLGIEIVAGRNFSDEFKADQADAIIINETAVKKFEWDNPVGKTIQYATGPDEFATGTVVGVVKDFHIRSLYRVIEPLFISNNTNNLNFIVIRVSPDNVSGALDYLKKKWREIDPDRPFDYFFLQESFDSKHRVVERIRDVFSFFTLFAIFIACLGIYALAAFTAEQRTKEIGIRKVLGATTSGIVFKLNSELIKLVILAIILAVPMTQIPTTDFLHQFFPYMADISILTFIKAAVLVFVIALATVSYQSIKVGRTNPVEALRYE